MKILYLITVGSPGGAQKYVLECARRFKGSVAVGGGPGWLADSCIREQIPVTRLHFLGRRVNPLWDFLAFWEIVWLLWRTSPDILHANSTKAGLLGRLAGFITRTPVIFTAHGYHFQEDGSPFRRRVSIWLEKFACLLSRQTIAVSDRDRNLALELGIVPADRIQTIHNGLGRVNFLERPAARHQLGVNEGEFVVGALANLYPNKGIDLLIEAATKVDAKFIVIGDGPSRRALETLIANKNLAGKFILFGIRLDAATFLKGFDAFVLPSRKEGFPFAVLEAMQAGLPIAAFDVGGVSEALDRDSIVPAGNTHLLAEKLNQIKTDSAFAQALTQKNSARVQEFTLDRMLSQTEQVYKSLLKSEPGVA